MPTFIWYIIGGIAVLSILVYFFQEKFIFKPENLNRISSLNMISLSKNIFLMLNRVRINGLAFLPGKTQRLILYFHGNTRSIKGWAKYARDFYRYDYDVVLVDYRGFGKSTGKRSEKEMLNDMQFVYDKLNGKIS